MNIRWVTLDPGHFHAALVQKFMHPDIDPVVHVYSPGGEELKQHLARIAQFNSRPEHPTRWIEQTYAGPDYFEKMLAEKAGNVVVLAGKNALKAHYILKSIEAGFHVLSDKPMIVLPEELPVLKRAFALAAEKRLLLYDIMTERHEITSLLQREFSRRPDLFGTIAPDTPEQPAVVKSSVHYFSKIVAGRPLQRPPWYFDTRQQGAGIVDVTTHLVDLTQWTAYPDQPLGPDDAVVLEARRWPTHLTLGQFQSVTGIDRFPPELSADVKPGGLEVSSNGEFLFRLKNIHARIKAVWDFAAPANGGDTHFSLLRGTKADLTIRQEAADRFKPVLRVENKAADLSDRQFEQALSEAVATLQANYPGVGFRREEPCWRIVVPESYDVGHEAHFAQVAENFLRYLREGQMPAWEVPNMISKYGILMQAHRLANSLHG